jgi:hypothetical protein
MMKHMGRFEREAGDLGSTGGAGTGEDGPEAMVAAPDAVDGGRARTGEILDKIVQGAPGFAEETDREHSHAETEPRELYCSPECLKQSVKGGIPDARYGDQWKWDFVDAGRGEKPVCSKCGASFIDDGKSIPQGVVSIPHIKVAEAAEKKRTMAEE